MTKQQMKRRLRAQAKRIKALRRERNNANPEIEAMMLQLMEIFYSDEQPGAY